MNKCNFCAWAKPTGQIGAWECCAGGNFGTCKQALQTMMRYAELRASGNKDILIAVQQELDREVEAISRLR